MVNFIIHLDLEKNWEAKNVANHIFVLSLIYSCIRIYKYNLLQDCDCNFAWDLMLMSLCNLYILIVFIHEETSKQEDIHPMIYFTAL